MNKLALFRYAYNLSIGLYGLLIRIAAAFGNPKARLFVAGRRQWQLKLPQTSQKVIWLHCASLGEYEQAIPIIECIRRDFPAIFLAVTFFSPSGYEARKNSPLADWVGYLPLDTAPNATEFIQKLSPIAAIFVKYEWWYHFLNTCNQNLVPLFLIGGRLHAAYWGLKWGKFWFNNLINSFQKIYTLDETSAVLFKQIVSPKKVILAGDTRYDRVATIKHSRKSMPEIVSFVQNTPVIVAGSVWEKDVIFLLEACNEMIHLDWKMIWVPHEPTPQAVEFIKQRTNGVSLTELEKSQELPNGIRNLIIDRVGLLAGIYSLGRFAWVGGAFGAGLHNILEPLSLGIPTAFGNKIAKFPEANEAVAQKIAHSCHLPKELISFVTPILTNRFVSERYQEKIRNFMRLQEGATSKIWQDLAPEITENYPQSHR